MCGAVSTSTAEVDSFENASHQDLWTLLNMFLSKSGQKRLTIK
jgi:hypothetical protein